MGLDIRLPIGIIFTIYGLILVIYGAVADPSIFQEKSLGVNIDIWWGLAMMVFGVFMGALAFRASRRSEP
jgi:steroid 5-alpha reductase family enzyme